MVYSTDIFSTARGACGAPHRTNVLRQEQVSSVSERAQP